MAVTSPRPFGRWRALLWPIHRHELPKLLPMFLIIFLICFSYSVLRNMKDALVCTAPSSGAEVIPFIKVWMMLPGALFATFIYTRLSNYFSQEKVFYIMTSGFICCYLVFAFVLYPQREVLHLSDSADKLEMLLPVGFKGFVAMFRNWTFTLFYVSCELWGCMVLTVLFWGFANQVTDVPEAKRFFGVFTVGGNLAAVAAGKVSIYVTQLEYLPQYYGMDSWEQTVAFLVSMISVASVIMMMTFRWVNRRIPSAAERGWKPKPLAKKPSLRQSFRGIAKSRYLFYIAVMVVAYNIVINLVEVIFKDRLRQLCPDPQAFNTYINQLTVVQGVVSTLLAMLIAYFLSRWGWTRTALFTPVSMLITSCGFFAFLFLPESVSSGIAGLFLLTPLGMAAIFGGMQNCLSKAAKYSLFDTTKEMAFIPLPIELKVQGKAAIDGVGSRFGKWGGSLIHQALLLFCGTLIGSAPYVAALLLVAVVYWIYCTKALGVEFEELSSQQSAEAPQQSADLLEPVPATT